MDIEIDIIDINMNITIDIDININIHILQREIEYYETSIDHLELRAGPVKIIKIYVNIRTLIRTIRTIVRSHLAHDVDVAALHEMKTEPFVTSSRRC